MGKMPKVAKVTSVVRRRKRAGDKGIHNPLLDTN